MVSVRCKMIVHQELKNLSIRPRSVELGEVDLDYNLSDEKRKQFAEALLKWQLELITDRKIALIERVKGVVIEMVYGLERIPNVNFSTYLASKLNYDYTYLSNTFSHITGNTIEQFIILHKIERVKNLIMDDELSINEIADRLNYSSSAHLSNQFKKTTGLTPSLFKRIRLRTRNGVNSISAF